MGIPTTFNLNALALGAGLALFGILALALIALLPAALALLPVSGAWLHVLGLVRWPVLAGVIIAVLGIVYHYAPDQADTRWQWISWGSVAATALWIVGSIAFTAYVSEVGSYDRTCVAASARGRHDFAALVLSDRVRHPRRG